jgi:hypothetical protein
LTGVAATASAGTLVASSITFAYLAGVSATAAAGIMAAKGDGRAVLLGSGGTSAAGALFADGGGVTPRDPRRVIIVMPEVRGYIVGPESRLVTVTGGVSTFTTSVAAETRLVAVTG